MKFPAVVAVLCVVPSGLVLHIGITSCTFPPWTEMSKKNRYELGMYELFLFCFVFFFSKRRAECYVLSQDG